MAHMLVGYGLCYAPPPHPRRYPRLLAYEYRVVYEPTGCTAFRTLDYLGARPSGTLYLLVLDRVLCPCIRDAVTRMTWVLFFPELNNISDVNVGAPGR